jgi:predicted nuclease of predicted toxin-antitoxin system
LKRLLLDQGPPRTTAQLLRDAGWDALHVGECGLGAATDSTILAFAREQDRCVCTLNADFHALLVLSRECKPSVVRIRREGLRAMELFALLTALWPRIHSAVTAGAIVSITERALRIRNLPVTGR